MIKTPPMTGRKFSSDDESIILSDSWLWPFFDDNALFFEFIACIVQTYILYILKSLFIYYFVFK